MKGEVEEAAKGMVMATETETAKGMVMATVMVTTALVTRVNG